MKIAIVSLLMVSVPPPKYGGIEQIISELAKGLGRRDHKITVFCSGGSTIAGENITRVESSPYPTREYLHENRQYEIAEINSVLDRQSEFDLIHFNYEPAVLRIEENGQLKNRLDELKKPAVCTFHNITNIPSHIEYYRGAKSIYRHMMVFISNKQRSYVPFFPNSRIIYNGLPSNKFEIGREKRDFLLFLGRLTAEKGVLEAIQVAKKIKMPLVIVGKIDPTDKEFYEKKVRPQIDNELIRYAGEVDESEKKEYLKQARCLIFPIQWEEPFGLVMIEALACGTPVVALKRGSVPEVIEDGVTGFVVKTLDEMINKIPKIAQISPEACRQSFEKRFSAKRMIDEYEKTFLSFHTS